MSGVLEIGPARSQRRIRQKKSADQTSVAFSREFEPVAWRSVAGQLAIQSTRRSLTGRCWLMVRMWI